MRPTSGFRHCSRSEEHTSELQSLRHLVCRLLLEKKKPDGRERLPFTRRCVDAPRRISVALPICAGEARCPYSHCVGLEAYMNSVFFFFNDTATTEIYTLSLHDALPIWATWYAIASTDADSAASNIGASA